MKRLLFISPVLPDVNGGGREKRAHQWMHVLSKDFQIELLVITRDTSLPVVSKNLFHLNLVAADEPTWGFRAQFFSFVKSIFSDSVSGFTNLDWVPLSLMHKRKLKTLYSDGQFDVLFCFRLYLAEFAFYIQKITRSPEIELDMDDIESFTRKKIAKLFFRKRRYKKAFRYQLSSFFFYLHERIATAKFHRIYLCSSEDKNRLERCKCSKFKVFPNKICGTPALLNNPPKAHTLLFVGSFGYYPNVEAVEWFVRNVFPALKLDRQWQLNVAGYGTNQELKKMLSGIRGIHFLGSQPCLQKLYEESNIVIAPLHAGGGTKLKVLEAMWYGRPVVATKEAVYGLGLVPERHYLAADTVNDFITQCRRLAEDEVLYRQICLDAAAAVKSNYCYYP